MSDCHSQPGNSAALILHTLGHYRNGEDNTGVFLVKPNCHHFDTIVIHEDWMWKEKKDHQSWHQEAQQHWDQDIEFPVEDKISSSIHFSLTPTDINTNTGHQPTDCLGAALQFSDRNCPKHLQVGLGIAPKTSYTQSMCSSTKLEPFPFWALYVQMYSHFGLQLQSIFILQRNYELTISHGGLTKEEAIATFLN